LACYSASRNRYMRYAHARKPVGLSSCKAASGSVRKTPTGTPIPARYRTRSAIEHSVVAIQL
jgi:hypothetical protein